MLDGHLACPLSVLPVNMTTGDGNDAANIQDMQPNVNIAPVRHVPVAVEPSGRRGDGRRHGCADAAALHADDGRTMDARIAERHDWRAAGGERFVPARLHWGGQIQVQSAGQTDIDVD